MNQDVLLYVLKYLGSLVAGAYGVYATLTDFKEERNGKKILGKKGYFGLALLVASTLIGLLSDGFKDLRDRKRAVEELQRAQHAELIQNEMSHRISEQLHISSNMSGNLSRTASGLERASTAIHDNVITTKSVLTQTTRVLDLLPTNLTVTFELRVRANQPQVVAYLGRLDALRRSGQRPSGYQPAILSVQAQGSAWIEKYEYGSPEYPREDLGDERRLFYFASQVVPSQFGVIDGLWFEVDCEGSPEQPQIPWRSLAKSLEITVPYMVEGHYERALVLSCTSKSVRFLSRSGTTLSFRDLAGKKIEAVLYDSPIEFDLLRLRIRADSGREIWADSFREKQNCKPYRCFTGLFRQLR